MSPRITSVLALLAGIVIAEGAGAISKQQCPDTWWIRLNNSCYRALGCARYSLPKHCNTNTPIKYCREKGGRKAWVESDAVNKFLLPLGVERLEEMLIAGERNNTNNGTYAFPNGELLKYTNWKDGEPAGKVGKNCIAVAVTGKDKGKWFEVACYRIYLYAYMCEVVLT